MKHSSFSQFSMPGLVLEFLLYIHELAFAEGACTKSSRFFFYRDRGTYSSFCVHNSTNNEENYSRAVVHEAELPSCKGEAYRSRLFRSFCDVMTTNFQTMLLCINFGVPALIHGAVFV
ncbi:hypothetical protein NC652_030973 [Populus alba x Populus x berolinensis]|nr:hypothetical protein NC652_030973 [Populus alba x Populus x berolinensis]